jgi:hypothetical protein
LHGELDEGEHKGKLYSGEKNFRVVRSIFRQAIHRGTLNPDAYTHPDRKVKPDWEERKELMLKVMEAYLTALRAW